MPEPSKGIGASDFGTEMTGGVNYLLVIAVDAYQRMPRLYKCKKDAEAFIDLLLKNYQFEETHVVRVFDEDATEDGMHAAFRDLVQKVTPKDSLVVYFSGHGEYDSLINEGYWIPIEAHQRSLDEVGWYLDNSGRKTHPVGSKKVPNELGIFDMSGNVLEWCADWYGEYSSDAQTNPAGPVKGSSRVRRGGGWNATPRYSRVSSRLNTAPAARYFSVGFRLARSL